VNIIEASTKAAVERVNNPDFMAVSFQGFKKTNLKRWLYIDYRLHRKHAQHVDKFRGKRGRSYFAGGGHQQSPAGSFCLL
jgi:hypothetical protein